MTGSAREVAAALTARQSFLLTSHARPDGDAIGSPLALALALKTRGKSVRVLLRDSPRAPVYLRREKRFVHPDPRVYLSLLELVAGMVEEEDGAGDAGLGRCRVGWPHCTRPGEG